MYAPLVGEFRTPRGAPLVVHYRADTNDWNTANASTTEDEYHLRDLPPLTGWALDIGGYLGTVGISLAVDNPGLNVVIVEPVPENAALIRQNIEANGVADRVTLLEAGAAGPDVTKSTIRYRYRGSTLADHHAFVGNASLVDGAGATGVEHDERPIACYSLSSFANIERFALVKIDCEGCEWSVLTDPAVARVDRFVGEWHPTGGKTQADLLGLLSGTHDVTWDGPHPEGPQGFVAVRRG